MSGCGQAGLVSYSSVSRLPTAPSSSPWSHLMCLRGFRALSSGREGCGRHGSQLLSPPSRAGVCRQDLCWVFQETPTKELGHCGGAARSPEREQPRAGGRFPAPGAGPELRELHRTKKVPHSGGRLRTQRKIRGV